MKSPIAFTLGLVALLAQPGVLSIHAQTTSGTLTTDETWSGTVVLTGDVTVPAGVTLTAQPGAVIKGRSYFQSIFVRGGLVAKGLTGAPVVFTSEANSGPDEWGGIVFEDGSHGILEQAELRYGGGESAAMLEVNDTAEVTVRDCLFRRSGEDGIRVRRVEDPNRMRIESCRFEQNSGNGIECNDASPTISASQFVANEGGAIYLTGNSYPVFAGDLVADRDGIWLRGATLTRSGTREYAGIPYILDGDVTVSAGVRLVIEPGVIVKVDSYFNSIVVDGQMDIQGAAEAPVVFTSLTDDSVGGDTNADGGATTPAGDEWGGVYFNAGSTGTVEHAEFRYGGGESAGMIEINNADQVEVRNTVLRRSGEDGIRVRKGADPARVRIEGCWFDANADDAIECNDSSPAIFASRFTKNEGGPIYLTGTSFPSFRGDLQADWGGILMAAVTLSAGGTREFAGIPYVLGGDQVVPAGVRVVIEPGVIVKGNSYFHSLFVDGVLELTGTSEAPIIFTAWADDSAGGDTNGDGETTKPKPDAWGGIVFNAGSTGLVEHAEFRYGGGESAGMIEVNNAAEVTILSSVFRRSGEDGIRVRNVADPARVRIVGSVFEANADDGIECNDGSPTVSGGSFSGNRTSMHLTGTSYPQCDGGASTGIEGVWLNGTTLQRDGHWQALGVPYVLDGDVVVPAGVTLTIDPGVTIKGRYYFNSVIVEGNLQIAGLTNRPVVWTSIQDDAAGGDTNRDGAESKPEGNQWGGLLFQPGSTGAVAHAEFRYGGGELAGMIEADQPAQLTLDDVRLQHSGEDGIRLRNVTDPAQVLLRDCRFENNADDGVECNDASPTVRSCGFTGHGAAAIRLTRTSYPVFDGSLMTAGEGIWLNPTTLSRSGAFRYAGIPYVLDGDLVIPEGVRLAIEAGVIIKGTYYFNSISVSGQLDILGTESQPVWLTAYADDVGGDTNRDAGEQEPARDAWGGIVFQNGSSGSLRHVNLRYGGGETTALLEIRSAPVVVERCSFRNSGQDGVRVVEYDLAGEPLPIHLCTVAGNSRYGISNATTKDVDATGNWWGSASGPFHPTKNPAGTGNEVTAHVLFDPVLATPPGDSALWPRITVHPKGQGVPAGSSVTLEVVAEGPGTLVYQWFLEDQPVNGATLDRLLISPATLERAGTYAVRVSNEHGSVWSDPAELEITGGVERDSNWSARSKVLYNSAEAEILVRTGDIDNLGFGWPAGFDPFTGASTPVHLYPWLVDPADPEGTDRIMVGTSFVGPPSAGSDGYTRQTSRPGNQVAPVTLVFDPKGVVVRTAVLQLFVDDVQPLSFGSRYTVKLDGRSAPEMAAALNQLNQTGPIGKLMTFLLPSDTLDLLQDGRLEVLIDDLTSGVGDGFAIDFARLLINPAPFEHVGKVQGRVTDARTGGPLESALVSVGGLMSTNTDAGGGYVLAGLPAGLTVVQVTKPGYLTARRSTDVVAGQSATLDFSLVAAEPIRITGIRVEVDQIALTWEGGEGPFLVWRASALDAGSWSTTLETSTRAAVLPVDNQAAFFRIQQKP